MAYSKDLRERILAYKARGNSIKKTSEVFQVGKTKIKAWKRQQGTTGGVEKRS